MSAHYDTSRARTHDAVCETGSRQRTTHCATEAEIYVYLRKSLTCEDAADIVKIIQCKLTRLMITYAIATVMRGVPRVSERLL